MEYFITGYAVARSMGHDHFTSFIYALINMLVP
jgi:hypothetical protein